MKSRWASLAALLVLLAVGGFLFRPDPSRVPQTPAPEVDPDRPVTLDDFRTFVPDEPVFAASSPPPAIELPVPTPDAIPGEYTVRFDSAESLAAFLEQAAANGLTIKGIIPELLVARVGGNADALANLAQQGLELENNYRVRAPTVPDMDLWQAASFGAFNDAILAYLGVPDTADHLSWGKGITIAILDTGWDGHKSVAEGTVREIDILDSSAEGEYAGHGTAVAGLIASTDPFAPGIAPGSDLLSIRVLDSSGSGDAFTLAQGIIAAVNNGARVINMSLGGYSDSSVLRDAIRYATGQGAVLVAAAGNDGLAQVTYPAAYPQVIGVNAVDANGNRTPFSNYGAGIDVAAPGYQINALWEDDAFVYFDGTSASAPLVSGMAARLLQTGAATTPEQGQALIRQYANDTGFPGEDLQYGAGILNAARLESLDQRGIYDLALADLYPAIEESDGASVPLYVTFQNRGTEFSPGTSVDISVNGSPYFYRLPTMPPGKVESVIVPIPLTRVNSGDPFKVTAVARVPDGFPDANPQNNGGRIVLTRQPEE
jgi:hypothetical protein